MRAVTYLASLMFIFGLSSTFSPLSPSPLPGMASDIRPAGGQRSATISAGTPQTSPQTSAPLPQLVDITGSTGIKFEHLSSPEQKYIVESMSGGVALIDYDRDGWPDIYFTNAQSVGMALAGKKSGARYSTTITMELLPMSPTKRA